MALKYDADSGHVFTETICSVLPSRPDWTQCRKVLGRNEPEERPFLNWSLQSKERRRNKIDANQRPAKGASKLLVICERACTDNLDRLSLHALRELPMHLGRQIHDVAMERDLLSLNFWKAFIRAYHRTSANNDDDVQNFNPDKARSVFLAHLSMQDFSLPLRTHVMYTVSQSCEWLSAISIQRCRPDLADFMSLADLPNLALLQLEKVGTFQEYILRAWSQRAVESDGSAFPRLRVLSLHDMLLHRQCLGYLETLPALYAFGLDGHLIGDRCFKPGSWERLSKPCSTASDYRKLHGDYERELLQKFSLLDIEERSQLYFHQGPYWTFTNGLSYFRLLNRSEIKVLQRNYSDEDPLNYEWAEVKWWFRSNSTQSIAEPRETPKEARTAPKRSTVVVPTKMKKIGNVLGELM